MASLHPGMIGISPSISVPALTAGVIQRFPKDFASFVQYAIPAEAITKV